MSAELAALAPRWIGDGVLVRSDGVAVAVLQGGAAPWGLTAASEQAATAQRYHRLLLGLEGPVVCMQLDAPPTAPALLARLDAQAAQAAHPLHAAILTASADRLDSLIPHTRT